MVVDGSATAGTVLCLSHWPGSQSPARYRADLSAQMAFAYLGDYDLHTPAEAVSNNHFDQDGLVGIYALAQPERALARRQLLIDVARAGDFSTFDDRRAAWVSMAISAFSVPATSPVTGLSSDYAAQTGQLYQELLGRLEELCDKPEQYRSLWAEEDAALSSSEAALANGHATVEEVPDIDLAVVSVDRSVVTTGGHRFGGRWAEGLHPMALYNSTDRFVILSVQGQRYEVTCRYETWVQYQSRPLRSRRDLRPSAEALNEVETAPATWGAEGPNGLTPTLRLDGGAESELRPAQFRALVERHLRTAPPAWGPMGAIP